MKNQGLRSSYKWYVLAVLCLLTLSSGLDRQLPTILVGPLKERFLISDTQYGMLQGIAFALTYSIFAVPFGILVDRSNRRNIIAVGVLAWSCLTIAPAFATSFTQLVIFRLGVGIGEAILAPAAYSLITEYFEPRLRGRAAGIYYMSMAVGSGASLIVGGFLLRELPPRGIILAGQAFAPWQAVFLFTGLSGLLVVALTTTIREPARVVATDTAGPSVKRTFHYMWRHRAVLGRISLASALMAMVGYGTSAWLPAYFERKFFIPPSHSGPLIGLMFIATSMVGPLLGGWLSDSWAGRGRRDARFRVLFVAFVVLLPASFWALMPWAWLSFALCTMLMFAIALLQSSVPLVLQEAVPDDMRGQVVALQYLVLGLVGIGFGPAIVPMINSYIFGSETMLHWSLTFVALSAGAIGFWLCRSLVQIVRNAADDIPMQA